MTARSRRSRGQLLLLAAIGSALGTACSHSGPSTSGVASCYRVGPDGKEVVQDTGCDMATSYCSFGYCTRLSVACIGHGNCECLTSNCNEPKTSCQSDGTGGLDFGCYPTQGCYGSPPARLERLARAAVG